MEISSAFVVDQHPSRSHSVNPCPSLVGPELMTTENSEGVFDAVAMELIQIAKATANEAEEFLFKEEEADLYKKSEASKVNTTASGAKDAAANKVKAIEGDQERGERIA
ncbi:hypothetical protein KC19_VG110400 [Ceratodon purpureus]|uniref:Uncharacterized protein n=1 Tax=Ceratodon purpureus TaxID=3225 RepID=A0A8T0HPT1_CERPU|nr:hypothetical protein KC19_VG110400 [Ceratodon purpureus]